MLSFDFSNAFTGLSKKVETDSVRLKEFQHFAKRLKSGGGEFLFSSIISEQKEIRRIKKFSRELQKKFDTMIIVGIGGSSLGARCLYNALAGEFSSHAVVKRSKGMKIYFLENIDPVSIKAVLNSIDPGRTAVNFISKSGSTMETMTQYFILKRFFLKKLGSRYSCNFMVTTAEPGSPLGRAAEEGNYEVFRISSALVGRFSVLSAVGLLPSACAGIDIDEVIEGARVAKESCLNTSLEENPATMGAYINYLHYRKGRKILPVMPYRDSLFAFGEWFAQLWAESLGKRDGSGQNQGQTPIRGIGTQDQHSLLQLYLDGPDDKLTLFLTADSPPDFRVRGADEKFAYLEGKMAGEVLAAEQKATEEALRFRGRPSWRVHLDAITAYNMGALLFAFQVMTAFAGNLFRVNPFDQPAVEDIKLRAKRILRRGAIHSDKDKFLLRVGAKTR